MISQCPSNHNPIAAFDPILNGDTRIRELKDEERVQIWDPDFPTEPTSHAKHVFLLVAG